MEPDATPSGKSVTLREMAKMLGVSHVTVSHALRGTSQVSEEMRQKVQELADRLNYRPNANALALAHRKKGKDQQTKASLAWLNLWDNPAMLRSFKEYDAYWIGAYETAERRGYRLTEFKLKECGSLKRMQQITRARGIRGILVPPHVRGFPWPEADWSDFAVVKFGYGLQGFDAHVAACDHFADVILAMRKIREKGYSRIGFVHGALSNTRFYSGYTQAQHLLELENHLETFLWPHYGKPIPRQQLKTWLRDNRPDAILTDIPELKKDLQELGISVPDDMGLAVLSLLDGQADAGIDQNSLAIGKAAADLLINLVHEEQWGLPSERRHILVEGRWADGSSLPCKSTSAER